MAVLIFEAISVQRLVEHAKCAPQHAMGYSDAQPKPALMLVGDQGVYLVSNGEPADKAEDAPSCFVAHARGHNPNIDHDWWDAKRASFGGDDGVEVLDIIPAVDLLLSRGEAEIKIEINDDHVGLLMPDVTWIKPGVSVRVRSGLGGMFNAVILEGSESEALVRRTNNSGDFDAAKPYRVKLGQIYPADTQETV